MAFEIRLHSVDYWQTISESEAWDIIQRHYRYMTPALMALASGEEIVTPELTLREGNGDGTEI